LRNTGLSGKIINGCAAADMEKIMIQTRDVQEVNSWRIYSRVLGNRISGIIPGSRPGDEGIRK
jgi:hypothetical protein